MISSVSPFGSRPQTTSNTQLPQPTSSPPPTVPLPGRRRGPPPPTRRWRPRPRRVWGSHPGRLGSARRSRRPNEANPGCRCKRFDPHRSPYHHVAQPAPKELQDLKRALIGEKIRAWEFSLPVAGPTCQKLQYTTFLTTVNLENDRIRLQFPGRRAVRVHSYTLYFLARSPQVRDLK